MRWSRSVSFIAIAPEYKRAGSASRRALGGLLAAALCVTGCADCGKSDGKRSAARPEIDPSKRLHDEIEARLADRKIDLARVYPKDAEGVVQCGEDSSCFIALVERCEPALFTHKRTTPGYVFAQELEARYRVAGKKDGGCELQRASVRMELTLDDKARAAIEKSGKDDAWIEQTRGETMAALLPGDPKRLTCVLPRDNALDLALDIADRRHVPGHFGKPGCREVGAGESWPKELTIAAPSAAPSTAPAEPKAPEPGE